MKHTFTAVADYSRLTPIWRPMVLRRYARHFAIDQD